MDALNSLKNVDKIFKIYDAFDRFETHDILYCGDKICTMPVVEIGFFEGSSTNLEKKPKLLITAGMKGNDLRSMSIAINFIEYIGNKINIR